MSSASVADARARFEHYQKKVGVLKDAQNARRTKGKADTKDQTEKLTRNEARALARPARARARLNPFSYSHEKN